MSVIDKLSILLVSCLLAVECFPHQDSPLGIINGHAVNITEVPFMARLRNLRYAITCGAAIVHEKYVISSAFCYYHWFQNMRFEPYVTVGTDNAKSDGEAYDVDKIYPHPLSKVEKSWRTDYDVAVVKLVQPFKFNERIRPIQLVEKDFVVPKGAVFDVMGFGVYARYRLQMPDLLQLASVPYVPKEKCSQAYANLTERMMCADGEGKGSCYTRRADEPPNSKCSSPPIYICEAGGITDALSVDIM